MFLVLLDVSLILCVCVCGKGGGGGGHAPCPPRTACYRALMIVKKHTPDHSLRNGLEGWQRARNDNLLTIAPPPHTKIIIRFSGINLSSILELCKPT